MGDNGAVWYSTPSAATKGAPASIGWWKAAWLALAIAYAVPLSWTAYERLTEVSQQARARLIEQHRLWELHPEYRGTPEIWTRIASRLLNDSQLMRRVAARHGPLSAQIELEYRRDLAIARAEVVLTAFGWWVLPLAALYGLARLVSRRARPAPPKVQPSSVFDPRYRPPEASE